MSVIYGFQIDPTRLATLYSQGPMPTESDTPIEEEELPDSSRHVSCPYCGETVELLLDSGSGETQEYIEDCEVCCQPWQVRVRYDDGWAEVHLEVLD